jgi:hypothetical protein
MAASEPIYSETAGDPKSGSHSWPLVIYPRFCTFYVLRLFVETHDSFLSQRIRYAAHAANHGY